MKTGASALAAVLLSAGVWSHASPSRAANDCAPGLFAEFSRKDPSRAAVDAEIERAIAPMSAFVRWAARSRLRDATPVGPTLRLGRTPELSTTMLDWTFSAPDGAPPRRATRPDGRPVALSHRCEGGRMIQVLSNKDGTRENVFGVSPDGQVLTMSTTISSPRLPSPVHYELRYQRLR